MASATRPDDPLVFAALDRIAAGSGLSATLCVRLRELAYGWTYEEIGKHHGITRNTVKTEVHNVLRSLDITCGHQIQDAVRAAAERARSGEGGEGIYAFLKMRFE